jgi:hypothetical protein
MMGLHPGQEVPEILLQKKVRYIILVSDADEHIPGHSYSEKNERAPTQGHLFQEGRPALHQEKEAYDQTGQQKPDRTLGQNGKTQHGVKQDQVNPAMRLTAKGGIKEKSSRRLKRRTKYRV